MTELYNDGWTKIKHHSYVQSGCTYYVMHCKFFVMFVIGISMCNAIIGLKVHNVTAYLQSLLKMCVTISTQSTANCFGSRTV